MSSFKIKSNLDIGGNQLLNYCVGTYDDLTSVNRNTGSKFFYVPQDSENDWYKRELIYDGKNWHAAAYLDDIDKITNGEGSLGMRVKALEDMLNVDSAETVVSTWEEIQAFLDNVKEGTDLMTMLDDKLSKSEGGTITGKTTIRTPDFGNQLCLDITNDSSNLIRFQKNGTNMGFIGFNSSDEPIYADKLGYSKILLHEGNVGDYTAGAANRLANKVSLWGNEFDGTQSLSGNIYMDNSRELCCKTTDNKVVSLVTINSKNNVLFAPGSISYKMSTYLYGTSIEFRTGSSYNTAMTITKEGNVLIGNSVTVNSAKFLVNGGTAHIHGLGSLASLGEVLDSGLTIGSAAYGISQWVTGSGQGNIQVGRFDGTATAYALNLNPLGGAVNVGGSLAPNVNNSLSLGTSSYRWSNVYSVGGNFSGRVLIGYEAVDDGSTALQVSGHVVIANNHDYNSYNTSGDKVSLLGITSQNKVVFGIGAYYYQLPSALYGKTIELKSGSNVLAASFDAKGLSTFHQGALIPTGQKLTIGDANGDHATIEYDSIAKAIKVDGNLFTTGTNASGGKADDQSGNTGGGSAEVYRHDLDWGEQVYEIQNVKGDVNVNVQVYEWNENGNSWDMILTDVSVTANIITVTFGRTTSVNHMVTVV